VRLIQCSPEWFDATAGFGEYPTLAYADAVSAVPGHVWQADRVVQAVSVDQRPPPLGETEALFSSEVGSAEAQIPTERDASAQLGAASPVYNRPSAQRRRCSAHEGAEASSQESKQDPSHTVGITSRRVTSGAAAQACPDGAGAAHASARPSLPDFSHVPDSAWRVTDDDSNLWPSSSSLHSSTRARQTGADSEFRVFQRSKRKARHRTGYFHRHVKLLGGMGALGRQLLRSGAKRQRQRESLLLVPDLPDPGSLARTLLNFV